MGLSGESRSENMSHKSRRMKVRGIHGVSLIFPLMFLMVPDAYALFPWNADVEFTIGSFIEKNPYWFTNGI